MNNPASIIQLRNDASYDSAPDLIVAKQKLYPSHYFYRPIGIEIEITNKCNIKCEGCGQRDEVFRPEDILTDQDYIEALDQAKKTPIFSYSITGGETFLFLERVKKMIKSAKGQLDLYKVNTNSYRFFSDEITEKVLKSFLKIGFSKNKYIKSVFVTSIAQQNKAGISLTNSVRLAKLFYSVFSFKESIISINATDKNLQKTHKWVENFLELYKKETGKDLDESKVIIRRFMLNNQATLERIGVDIKHTVYVNDLMKQFSKDYRLWKCLNSNTLDGHKEATTLTPRMVLRPNGDVYACPGYNYLHKVGNIKQKNLSQIIKDANNNKILKIMYTEGLPGLFELAVKKNPGLKKKKVALSFSPCDLCGFLSKYLTNE